MVDFPQMEPSHFLKLKWLRGKMGMLSLSQRSFIELIVDNKPLDDDQVLMLGQIYREVKDCLELPGNHDRGIVEIESFESCGRVG